MYFSPGAMLALTNTQDATTFSAQVTVNISQPIIKLVPLALLLCVNNSLIVTCKDPFEEITLIVACISECMVVSYFMLICRRYCFVIVFINLFYFSYSGVCVNNRSLVK